MRPCTKSYIFLSKYRLKRSWNCAYLCSLQNTKFSYARGFCPLATLATGSSPWTPMNAPCKRLVCSLHSQLLVFSQSWKSQGISSWPGALAKVNPALASRSFIVIRAFFVHMFWSDLENLYLMLCVSSCVDLSRWNFRWWSKTYFRKYRRKNKTKKSL